jgi:hypothetical protein
MGLNSAPSNEAFEAFQNQETEIIFRNFWTDNADVLSILYTGTPALKTDFTRTGKRSYKGALDDGYNSVKRYFINNFYDGYNCDCLDLAQKKLGPHIAPVRSRSAFSPLKQFIVGLIVMVYLVAYVLDKKFESKDLSMKDTIFQIVVYICVLLAGAVTVKSK